jgi:integrase
MARMGYDLRAWRNKALVAVARSTMLRRAELVGLEVSDYRRVAGEAFGRMAVRVTKTEEVSTRNIGTSRPGAAVQLEAWLAAANSAAGPLFRGLTPDWRVKSSALSAAEVGRAFKIIARLAGITGIGRIGAHSTRIGATHDLKLFGADTLDIMQDGGWKSPMMPKRYLQGVWRAIAARGREGARRAEPSRAAMAADHFRSRRCVRVPEFALQTRVGRWRTCATDHAATLEDCPSGILNDRDVDEHRHDAIGRPG